MAACLCAAGLLPLPFAMTPVHAAGLAALIDGAVQKDPAVLEALAREEQAQMQTQVSRSGHATIPRPASSPEPGAVVQPVSFDII